MNIISCDGCGVVFDKNKLNFPLEIYDEEKEDYDLSKCVYIKDSGFIAITTCPICKADILEDDV